MSGVYRLRGTYLLGGPADALLEPLGGEPHLDLLLGVLGGGGEPGKLRLRGVGELVERRHERQVPVQRGVVLGGVEGHRDLRHLEPHTGIMGRFLWLFYCDGGWWDSPWEIIRSLGLKKVTNYTARCECV